jgi:hypothetical protein
VFCGQVQFFFWQPTAGLTNRPGVRDSNPGAPLDIHAKKADNTKQSIVFHALWVLYLLSAINIALNIAILVVSEIVCDNERLLFGADQFCRSVTSL